MRNDTSSTMEANVYEWVFSKYPELRDRPGIKKRLRIELENSEDGEGLKIKVIRLKK